MRKTIVLFLSLIFLLLNMSLTAQEIKPRKNVTEVKANLFYLALGIFEIDLERTTNSNYSFGLALAASFTKHNEYVSAFNPFIRLYPFRVNGSSVFIEGSYALYRRDGGSVDPDYNTSFINGALGYKHLFSYGLSFEVLLGLGFPTNRVNSLTDINVFPRLGLFLGKRF